MSKPAFSLPAPAKLNLFLHITGQRQDGYHELQTLFAMLDYGDTLHFRAHDTLRIEVNGNAPAGDDNLVMKAARALSTHTNTQQGASITLEKRLPQGGGLGGGSSNAASTLLGLNYLWDLQLSLDELAAIGLSLGADVPVFVHGQSAWAEGIGEQLQSVDLPQKNYLVINPDVSISTKLIFSDPQLTRDTAKSRVAAFLEQSPGADFHNDCEAPAKRHFPAVAEALDWLEKHAGNARMTGTGACCFARLPDRQTGVRLLRQLPAHWSGFVAGNVKLSPAHLALQALSGNH